MTRKKRACAVNEIKMKQPKLTEKKQVKSDKYNRTINPL